MGVATIKHKEHGCGWLINVTKLIPKVSVAILKLTIIGCYIDK